MAAPSKVDNVELGFVEDTEPFLLRSRFFPSKVGGKPAWLSLKPLPTTETLSCGVCSKQTAFLLQIYSPNSTKPDSFHRTIFLFVCRDENCCKPNSSDNIRVFRSQLSKQNDFYSATPPKEEHVDSEPDASLLNRLCMVCGCEGPKSCSKCHKINYCSKQHQSLDWKAGHKHLCQTEESSTESVNRHRWLFPEMEVVTETEVLKEETVRDEKTSEEKLKEYEEYVKTHETTPDGHRQMSERELEKMATTESENDKQLKRFKKRLAQEPDQVLRYQKGGDPLWIADSPKPADVPDCSCGAKRQFEFQVLPQLLSHLNVDKVGASLDWGTLCIYTCSSNCPIGNQYKQEYVFKQDIV